MRLSGRPQKCVQYIHEEHRPWPVTTTPRSSRLSNRVPRAAFGQLDPSNIRVEFRLPEFDSRLGHICEVAIFDADARSTRERRRHVSASEARYPAFPERDPWHATSLIPQTVECGAQREVQERSSRDLRYIPCSNYGSSLVKVSIGYSEDWSKYRAMIPASFHANRGRAQRFRPDDYCAVLPPVKK